MQEAQAMMARHAQYQGPVAGSASPLTGGVPRHGMQFTSTSGVGEFAERSAANLSRDSDMTTRAHVPAGAATTLAQRVKVPVLYSQGPEYFPEKLPIDAVISLA